MSRARSWPSRRSGAWSGHDGLTFYVPFAAAVAPRRSRRAVATAMPQSTRTITSAGVALAASFGLLALVPLTPFRELAFAMAVGILLDVLVVCALLVPSLICVVGPVSGWPSRRVRRGD